MSTSPYSDLPARAFWRSAVTDRASLDPGDVYAPRFRIPRKARIVTAGSCFAQHVGRTLKTAGYDVLDTEPPPPGMTSATAQKFGYTLYSARYGNIYTVRQLLQLLDEAEGKVTPALPVWEHKGRFHDAFRPGVEPEGLDSPEDVAAHRKMHLAAVLKAFRAADVFVFTFGLTEAWVHTETGTVYPTAPGTIAGSHDPAVFSFKNYTYREIMPDFVEFRRRMMAHNPEIRFLITVSPVPLTATASGQHVEVATSYSKSVLRAVCGDLYDRFDNVDYYPSYEIITSQNARGAYYEANKRNVSEQGVATAMGVFLKAQGAGQMAEPEVSTTGRRQGHRRAAENVEQTDDTVRPVRGRRRAARLAAEAAGQGGESERPAKARRRAARLAAERAGQGAGTEPAQTADDVVCEEALLDAFRP
jgi:hypothetical protein